MIQISRSMLVLAALPLLGGCMTNPPMPTRPVLSCADCKGLDYYGPQQAPAEAPGVSLARVLVGGATRIADYGFAASTVKSGFDALAGAGQAWQPAPTAGNQPAPLVVRPEVVNQPAPLVVRPEVVNQPAPLVVQPEVVNQPAPLVVQPQVVSPEIVQPTIVNAGP